MLTGDLGITVAMYLGQISPEEAVAGGARIEGDPEAAARVWAILDIYSGPDAAETLDN